MGLRDLPSVDALADRIAAKLPAPLPMPLVRVLARDALDEARTLIKEGADIDVDTIAIPRAQRLASMRPQRVINATGVLLHTNLGRAPVDRDATLLGAEQQAGYGNVEFDLAKGARGGRGGYLAELLTSVTGAEAALAVNNNAAALFLSLAAIAGPAPVVVSRGELIEIGGSFRLPDLMAASGAELREVGTTNRTRAGDYEAALDGAALVLKVHPSNYRIEGFSEEVGYRQLAEVAHSRELPLVADVGSGLLDTRTPWLEGSPPSWVSGEPGVRQTLDAGADVVLFSGDKLLGGPQAGIAVGRADLIAKMKKHPVARAVRLDGGTAATLAATVEMYASGRGAEVPFWRMASESYESLTARHERLLEASGVAGTIVEAESVPGAGSVPGEAIASPAIKLDEPADAGWKRLVDSAIPVVGRRRDGALQIDLRSVDPGDDAYLADALASRR